MLGPQGSRLLSLAPELTLLISDELDIESVKSLRLTCKQLAEFLNDVILHTLTVNITKNNIEDGLSKIIALANLNHAAARATRQLCIKSLSPAYDPNYGGPTYTYTKGKWILEEEPEDLPEIVLAETEVKAKLFKALVSLKVIQSVSWIPCRKDSEWAQLAVRDALKEMTDLRQFKISVADLKIPLPITLTGLQEINIQGSCGQKGEGIYENLAKVIAASPQLTSLDVAYSWDYGRPVSSYQSLHQLFKYCDHNSAPLQLRHLSLSNCLVRLDNVTLPHLSHLTSLELLNIEDPFFQSSYIHEEEEDTDATAKKKRYGSSKDDIWKALVHVGTRLEEIVVDDATLGFLGYLSSYSGLKKLCLFPRNFFDGQSSDEVARKFFAKPFQNHCGSLQDLQIEAIFEGLWCFGKHNSLAISKCENLQTLSIAVVSSEIQNDNVPVGSEQTEHLDTIKQFLDIVVMHMPRIESVRIQAANLESLREAMCGNPVMSHFARVGSQITASVNNYVAPSSCHCLPSLAICSSRTTTLAEVKVLKDNKEPREPLRYVAKVLDDKYQ